MAMPKDIRYPSLSLVLVEIAYDNGMVNRFQSEEQAVAGMYTTLRRHYPESEIQRLSSALSLMTSKEKRIIAAGEDAEQKAIWAKYGTALEVKGDEMLNVAFDGPARL